MKVNRSKQNLENPRSTRVPAFVLFVLLVLSPIIAHAADGPATNTPAAAAPAPDVVTNYTYDVLNSYPHDTNAFTEGLDFVDGNLLESTGNFRNTKSTLREVELATGKMQRVTPLPPQYFGEGLAALNGKLYQLTWKDQKGFIYNQKTFAPLGQFTYAGEGWGLTTDGHWLIMSDGTDKIRFLDPSTFKVDHVINVTLRGDPMQYLNELEYVNGLIYANIWMTEDVAIIDPATGKIVGIIDFSHLLPLADHVQDQTDVLNGIAYDPKGNRLFITGKNWPKIFEVKLKVKKN